MTVLLCFQLICITALAQTKRAYMHLGCDGKGTLKFGGNTYPMVGMKGFPYKKEVMLWPKNTYKKKWSKEYGVNMEYAVGPIHWERGAYIHSGSLSYSVGCPHLEENNAIKFYKFVKNSNKVRLLTKLDYQDPSKCKGKPPTPTPKPTKKPTRSSSTGSDQSYWDWLKTKFNSLWSAHSELYNEYTDDGDDGDDRMDAQNVGYYEGNQQHIFSLIMMVFSIALILGCCICFGAVGGVSMVLCYFGALKKKVNQYRPIAQQPV